MHASQDILGHAVLKVNTHSPSTVPLKEGAGRYQVAKQAGYRRYEWLAKKKRISQSQPRWCGVTYDLVECQGWHRVVQLTQQCVQGSQEGWNPEFSAAGRRIIGHIIAEWTAGKQGVTHRGRNEMADILQTAFSNEFSLTKISILWLYYHWHLFLGFN